MLRLSSLLLAALSLSGCAGTGLSDKLPTLNVAVPADCENFARTVPHAPVAFGKSDARVAYWAEYDRLDTANDRIVATRDCQKQQRTSFGSQKR